MRVEQLLQSRIFAVERLTYTTGTGVRVQRDVVRHPGSVAIVPRVEDDQVCLIRNRRISVNQELIEIPAGTLEPPEPPHECAHRELIEETGFRAEVMNHVASFFPAPGILDEHMHLFEARGLTPGEPSREAGEEIDNLIVSLSEARSMIRSGQIKDAKTMIGLLLCDS